MNAQTEMSLNDYQRDAGLTAIYPGRGTPLGLIYCALKLNGEAGEAAEHVGKALRDEGLIGTSYYGPVLHLGTLSDAKRELIKKELGDALWYIAAAAGELGYSLEQIAQANLAKLADRASRGVIKGSGDDR